MNSMATLGVRTAERKFQKHVLNSRQLARLSADPCGARIVQAFNATADHRLAVEDRAWIDRIEALRAAMLVDDSVMTGTDFGAGSPSAPRSAEEMARGMEWLKPVRQICRASKSRTWGIFLMQLVREFGPNVALELGTCVGVSAAYQAAALAVRGAGTLTTLEGAASLAEYSRTNLRKLGLTNVTVVEGPFHSTLDQVLGSSQRVDYAYIDGHHDGDATVRYFTQIRQHATDDALIVFDDIRWSKGMQNAWRQIVGSAGIRIAVDLFDVGVIALGEAKAPLVAKLAF